MSKQLNSRRAFLRSTALVTGGIYIVPRHVLGRGYTPPSDFINLGIIGAGTQARGLANIFIDLEQTNVIAASDVNAKKMDAFVNSYISQHAKNNQSKTARDLHQYIDYLEMIERKDIDAVVVATPDHWHAKASIDSMAAGKHVYCEKPLSHTIREGRAMVNATKKYNRILQTGSQQRSEERFRKACELVRNGYLGKIKTVSVSVGNPYSACKLPYQPTPNHIDWDRWVGAAPMRPYHATLVDADFFPRWRWFKEFGGGIIADWGAHMFDIVQWALGFDHTGPVQFTPPREPNAVRGLSMLYENGIEVIHEDFCRGNAVRFKGEKGTLSVSRHFLDSDPAALVTATIGDNEIHLYQSAHHQQNWIDAIKNNTAPICDAEIGHRTASICHIANIAYELNRPVEWDPKNEIFIGDEEANLKRSKQYRTPYGISQLNSLT
ncbi:MAG: Gfo/Idh/MocA family protein [Flavobacteriaceae bacterium]